MHYQFHVNIYQRPSRLTLGERVELREIPLKRLCEADGRPPTFDQFLPKTFEGTVDSLLQLPQIDVEPDGFFVHSGLVGGVRWQLDGHLYDFGNRLHRLQLHGDCPSDRLDAVLDCLARPRGESSFAFELVREGVALDEASFRQWAAAPVS